MASKQAASAPAGRSAAPNGTVRKQKARAHESDEQREERNEQRRQARRCKLDALAASPSAGVPIGGSIASDRASTAALMLGVAVRSVLFVVKLRATDAADAAAAQAEDRQDRMEHEESFQAWLADPVAQDAAAEAERTAESRLAADRELSLRAAVLAGAPEFEWACVEVDAGAVHHAPDGDDAPGQWQLLSRETLAGRRRMYSHFRSFDGDVESARLHLRALTAPQVDGMQLDAARAWLNEQRVRMVEQLPESRWLPVRAAFLHVSDEGGHRSTVVHTGSPARQNAFLTGGEVRGQPEVCGGVHEYTLRLERCFQIPPERRLRRPANPPLLGLGGENWSVYFNPADGLVYIHDTTLRAEPEAPRKLRDQDQQEMHDWERAMEEQRIPSYEKERRIPRVRACSGGLDGPCTVRIGIDFGQRTLSFTVNEQQTVIVRTGVLDLHVPGGFHPTDAAPRVRFDSVEVLCSDAAACHPYYCQCREVTHAQGTAVTLECYKCVTPTTRESLLLAKPTTREPQLIMGLDPEGDIPYFYTEGDMERRLAINDGLYESRQSSAPSWFRELTSQCIGLARRTIRSIAVAGVSMFVPTSLPPPRQASYPLTSAGKKRFHDDRADWFERRTGRKLEGTTAEQWRAVHSVSRAFRTRGK